MTQIKKTGEIYELKRRYYSHQTKKEHEVKIRLLVREDEAGRKKIDLEDEKGRSEFVFIGSDPTRVATIAMMIHDATILIEDTPWTAEGKE